MESPLEKWARGTDRSRSTAPATRAVTGGQPSASHQSERRRPWPRYILRSRSSTTSAPSTQSARPTAPAASPRYAPPPRPGEYTTQEEIQQILQNVDLEV